MTATSRPTITVFTPTYNRAHLLPDAFESLRRQDFTDFEWLVVDDGSTDDTRGLVESWIGTTDFPIRYVYQDNAGKPAAYNRGVVEARGEFFAELDSDDHLFPYSLSRLHAAWLSIPAHARDGFVGVSGLAEDEHGRLRGNTFPTDPLDTDAASLRFRYGVTGDKFSLNRTDVLREYPFPVKPSSKFVSEDLVWFDIARSYRTRFVNEVLLSVAIDDGGQHLSHLSHAVVEGRLDLHRFIISEIPWLPWRNPYHLLRSAVAYGRYGYDLGSGLREQMAAVTSPAGKIAVALTSPAARLLAERDERSGAMNRK